MNRVIAFANQKGGVGKTSTVVNVAAGLAKIGKKVCLFDLDPQANATEALGIDPDSLDLTVYDLMLNNADPGDIVKQLNDNLWLIPSNIELAGAEVALANLAGKDSRLKKAIEKVLSVYDFDYVLIDCPPSLGQLTLNGLTAAKEIIVPLQAQFFSYKALSRLIETIETVKQYTNPDIRISGIVCTFYREQRTLNKTIDELLRERFGTTVFKTKISDNIKLAEAPSVGKDIFSYFPNCQGAWDYASLCDEIIKMEEIENG